MYFYYHIPVCSLVLFYKKKTKDLLHKVGYCQLEPRVDLADYSRCQWFRLERDYCSGQAERWANRTISQHESNNGVSYNYKIYIYILVYTVSDSFPVSVSTSRHPHIDSPTSSYPRPARSVAVRHISWLRPLCPFPLTTGHKCYSRRLNMTYFIFWQTVYTYIGLLHCDRDVVVIVLMLKWNLLRKS